MPIPRAVPGTAPEAKPRCGSHPPPAHPIALPVLRVETPGDPDKLHIRKSKSGPRRAAVLILVNALMAAHIVLWAALGMRKTLSPVEPSEARDAFDKGIVNTGFLFFAAALLSTLILGRWFCGWGCHVVSLQDFCAWLMKKAGVKPKPFRSRLLVVAPLLLGLYMFCYVPFLRWVVKPLSGDAWTTLAPWLGEPGRHPGFHSEFTKADFWGTFPAWYVAVPFLLVCGFATVYFLGAKGYCTYGCPYGGFFGPIDRLAPGRILVTDACEQCGHCTAVCTSNVRVHEEVRDFGMVVDPGCMKCLDCVSVCPNDALYFGFARPPAFLTKKSPRKRRLADAPLFAEIVLLLLGVALFWGFRNMFNQVPMLMATGLAACGAFLAWKLWEILRLPSVRLQSLQLKLKGRLRPAGLAFAALALATLAMGGWGLAVRTNVYLSEVLHARLTVTREQLLTPGFVPPPDQRELAARALAHLRRASRPSEGGWGWHRNRDSLLNRAYFAWVAGDPSEAERSLRTSIELSLSTRQLPEPDAVAFLGAAMQQRGATLPEITAVYRALLPRTASADVRLVLVQLLIAAGDPDGAAQQAEGAVSSEPLNLRTSFAAGRILAQLDRPDLALAAFTQATQLAPTSPDPRFYKGLCLIDLHRPAEAETDLREALRLAPDNKTYMQFLARLLRELGRPEEASQLEQRANNSVPAGTPQAPR